jgi:ribosome biogenesis SPOUT family RNA methylase Rps3
VIRGILGDLLNKGTKKINSLENRAISTGNLGNQNFKIPTKEIQWIVPWLFPRPCHFV